VLDSQKILQCCLLARLLKLTIEIHDSGLNFSLCSRHIAMISRGSESMRRSFRLPLMRMLTMGRLWAP
jgi:hypothetical protein